MRLTRWKSEATTSLTARALIANAARRRALQFLIELACTALHSLVRQTRQTRQTRHTSHKLEAAMTVALIFESAPPATLLFVETRDEHVGLAMQSGRRLIGSRETHNTLARMNRSVGHGYLISSRQRFPLSTIEARCQPRIVTGQILINDSSYRIADYFT